MKRKLSPALSTALVLLCAGVLFVLACLWAAPPEEESPQALEYAEYERAKVTRILADSTQADPVADGAFRGDQLMLVEILTGQYAGETLQVYNYVGPLYGGPLAEGDGAIVTISTYADGAHTGTVYEFDRTVSLGLLVGVFLLLAVAIGGKTGLKSLLGLVLTLACLFKILIPALFQGAPTLPTVFAVCAWIAVVSLVILGGVRKKTLCAIGGTLFGVAAAMVFGLMAQELTKIDGLRGEDVEALLQVRQTGGSIRLKDLLVGGFVLSALGAVMDVTMGIASSISEIHSASPAMGTAALFRSGMNVGRDMVGTMTNTLILAFLGSSFTLILYLWSMELQPHQLLSSALVTIEVISSLSSSIGVILAIPVTALLSAWAMGGKN